MKPFITIMIFAVTLLAGCKQQGGAAGGHGGSTIDVPQFSITITLDEPASNKLKQAGESIKGAIYFDGDGTPQPGVKTAPMRDVILGSFEFELEESGTIKIDNAVISAEAYSRLSDENYHFFINVYSGRKSFKNNVLSGGYGDGRFKDLQAGKNIKIHCSLL
jgi:hypothetical protein